MLITLPSVLALDELRARNRIRQIAEPTQQLEGTLVPFMRDRIRGFLFRSTASGEETLIIPKKVPLPAGILRVVVGDISADADVADLRSGIWLKHPLQSGTRGVFDFGLELEAVLNSWKDAFSYEIGRAHV